MHADSLNLLVLADPHYTALARHACPHASRHAPLARILIRKVIAHVAEKGVTPDAIVLLGDLVDNGDAPDAQRDLTALAGEVLPTGIPVYAVSGNHDGPGDAVARAFGTAPGLHRIGNYGLLLFQDLPLGGDVFERDPAQLALPETAAARDPSLILVALQHEPERVAEAYGDALRGRMVAYRRFAAGLRCNPFVRIGLEVELLDDGNLLLAPEDREGWDYLLGAIHAIDGQTRGDSQSKSETLFLRDLDRLLEHPIRVLAHPFRYFERGGLAKPEHLYDAVAERLAARGVAAEVNYHTNVPEPAFFRACLDRGVKLALGTDSHKTTEVGDLHRHVRFLRSLGVDDARLADVLYRPA
jgi:histidinol phosphatase-like PHP family hydrolase